MACYVASIGRILWPVDKGYSGMVLGRKLVCTGAAKGLSGTSVCGIRAIAWLGASSGMQLRGFSTQLRSPCTMSTLQLRMCITSSSKLRFGCSWTIWKAL